ncbi:MAG: hypothetical protein ACQKBV_10310 [Puniceicoccales bacterium]
MKHILKSCLICALILTLGSAASYARGGHNHGDSEALAALGGFVGGYITAELINDGQRGHHYAGPQQCGFSEPPRHHQGGYSKGHKQCRCGGGYYDVVVRRVWVPGEWAWRWNSCGERIRYRKAGCFRLQRERVWVPCKGRCR